MHPEIRERQLRVPGDKSITHRALILAALATGSSRIMRSLVGADTQSTAAALRSLGVSLPALTDDLTIEGAGLHGLRAAAGMIDCGNSGTTARLLMGALAGCPFDSTLTGDASLCSRPMRRVTVPLALMGAAFHELGAPDRLPIRMKGGALRPLHYDSPHASAQVKSAILLAGLTGSADVVVTEPFLSRDHTERMLGRLGVRLRRGLSADGRPEVALSPVAHLDAFEIEVPGDLSSAAFMIAHALLSASVPVRIRDVGLNPARTGFLDVVQRMGGRVSVENARESCGEPLGDIVVEQSTLQAAHITAAEVPSLVDEIPVLAVLAALADGTTVIEGAGELRVKESDRITAMVDNLMAVGAVAEERPDGLVVHGSPVRRGGGPPLRGDVRVHGDHRIAMAFGVLGAVTGGGVRVDDPDAVAVSFPGFWDMLAGSAEHLR
ncbi:MAG TPA: 3-phosphoshikimate 1-carboxyvinyltransferase [Longimicrobiales bacterium]|nr:3-phosphoshikimate 1-carboxyvinyltransferase [Longimicrobiales bacterium]